MNSFDEWGGWFRRPSAAADAHPFDACLRAGLVVDAQADSAAQLAFHDLTERRVGPLLEHLPPTAQQCLLGAGRKLLVHPRDGQLQVLADGVQAGILGNHAEFFREVPEGPFYGYNRPGAVPSEAVIANWWRQGMAGSIQAAYETVFSWKEDYTADLEQITVPVLVMHGEDDQIVPFGSSVPRTVEHLKNGTLKTYAGYPHGMLTTHADVLNPDLLAFVQS